jgi:hypothetical protein
LLRQQCEDILALYAEAIADSDNWICGRKKKKKKKKKWELEEILRFKPIGHMT